MNNLITNFPQILEFANSLNLPLNRPRGIIREYLQSRLISSLYSQSAAQKLVFVGGTSLRLLRDIDRFSDDLDFDNLGLSNGEIDTLINYLANSLTHENIPVEVHVTHKGQKNYYDLRFPQLLSDLKITTNDKEKLQIKIDYSSEWQGHQTEAVLFSKYGFIEKVITNPLNHLLVQKLAAYVERNQTQPRDIYDIIWLYGQGARFDLPFAQANNLESVVKKSQKKYQAEKISSTLRNRLKPFLFVQDNINKLDLFPEVLSALS